MQLFIVQKGRERTCPNHKSPETLKNKYLYLLNRDRQINEQSKLWYRELQQKFELYL